MAERQRPASKKRPAKGSPGGFRTTASSALPASESIPALATAEKSPRPRTAPLAPVPGSKAAAPALRVEALQGEIIRLTRELDAAQARIATLEQAREQVLNRIDWVIDSLHSLSED